MSNYLLFTDLIDSGTVLIKLITVNVALCVCRSCSRLFISSTVAVQSCFRHSPPDSSTEAHSEAVARWWQHRADPAVSGHPGHYVSGHSAQTPAQESSRQVSHSNGLL